MCEELKIYLNYYTNELSKTNVSDTIDKKSELYASVFGSNILTIKNYSSLLKCFSGDFPNLKQLQDVERERLDILINAGKIPFNQDAITTMNDTDAFVEYIVYHSNLFAMNLDLEYHFNENNTYEILTRGRFSIENKFNIIGIIPHNILQHSSSLADIAIEVFSQKQQVNIEYDILAKLLKISNNESQKVQLTTSIIRNGEYSQGNINLLLSAIGGVYADICNNEKRAKLTNNALNIQLLETLQKVGFISSFREDKDQLRVYHKMQK